MITRLNNLETLDSIGAPLTEIPNTLGRPQRLQKLSLPQSFNEYLNRTSMSGGELEITLITLPGYFGDLENLKELDLSFCALDDVRVLSKLEKLQILPPVKNVTFLGDVQIYDKPSQFKKIQNL